MTLALSPFIDVPAFAATTPNVLWTAGGLDAGNTGAGQAARIATDASGNVAVVSGPIGGRNLAVTSYTAAGSFRWRSTVTPATGTFVGDWVAAAPNGDFVAIGHNQDSQGRPIISTMVRYASDGSLLWRVDFSAPFYPAVARLLVDAAGNEYVAWSAVGSGIFVQKYSPSGALLWSQQNLANGGFAVASSLALSPDGADVVVSGSVSGGAIWITALYDTASGAQRWGVAASEGTAARDVVVDATRVYVTGQGVTGAGTPAITYHLTVIAYDRATGARLWRTDKKPTDGTSGAGLWLTLSPDGSLVATGYANRGFLDWYTVAFETTGAVRWEAIRDGGLNTDEIPAGVFVLTDGTTVVTGRGGPNLPGGFIPGVTVGYSPNGTFLWEAFSNLATVWATALPNGTVCATGGYDALITCWQVSGGVISTPTPTPGLPTSTPVPPTPTNTPAPVNSTGFLSPSANAAQTTGAGDNNGYQTSPANAYANDSVVATDLNSGKNNSTSCTNSGKDRHLFYNFNFNIPSAAVIQGIQVRLDARVDDTNGAPNICVELSWDGGATWTVAKTTPTLSSTETTYILGDSLDTWSRAWSSGNLSNANFRIRVTDVASNTRRDFFLDYLAVNVTYQP
ncbi:MAG: hypothetical protein H6654_10765 [Ardenticatenaceae bacterium]|nr:hypothetical protein [Ardenticatenaceae bacterium]